MTSDDDIRDILTTYKFTTVDDNYNNFCVYKKKHDDEGEQRLTLVAYARRAKEFCPLELRASSNETR